MNYLKHKHSMTLRNLNSKEKIRRAVKIIRSRIEASTIVKLNVKHECNKVARQHKLNAGSLETAYYRMFKKQKAVVKTVRFTYTFERSLAVYFSEMNLLGKSYSRIDIISDCEMCCTRIEKSSNIQMD